MANTNERIKTLREKYGYTQEELAQRLGLTKNAISLYEHGKRNPSIETLEALCDIFNVTMDYLTGNSDTTEVIPEIDFFLNDDERILIEVYRKSDSTTRALIQHLISLSEHSTN